MVGLGEQNYNQEALNRSVQQIVRRELVQSEERIEARIQAITDDLRSEIRALRRSDEAIEARLSATIDRVSSMDAINRETIQIGVKQAISEMFSVKRILAFITILLGVVSAAVTLANEFARLV